MSVFANVAEYRAVEIQYRDKHLKCCLAAAGRAFRLNVQLIVLAELRIISLAAYLYAFELAFRIRETLRQLCIYSAVVPAVFLLVIFPAAVCRYPCLYAELVGNGYRFRDSCAELFQAVGIGIIAFIIFNSREIKTRMGDVACGIQ